MGHHDQNIFEMISVGWMVADEAGVAQFETSHLSSVFQYHQSLQKKRKLIKQYFSFGIRKF
jgi:hypothetical protein